MIFVSARDDSGDQLNNIDIHKVLSNERRRRVLNLLMESDQGTLTARELSERIAETEANESPAPRNIRQSVYVSLHQTHLPKLSNLSIIDYDDSAKTVTLSERAEQVSIYLESVPKYGLSWSEYYGTVSILGSLIVLASELGVPIIAELEAIYLATAMFVLIGVSAIFQIHQQESSIVHRLLENDR